LKGDLIEKRVLYILSHSLDNLSFEEADGYVDTEKRIDIIAKYKGKEIAGIQVKPETFKKMRSEVLSFQNSANKSWGKPVYMLFYNEDEEFVNLEEMQGFLNSIIDQ